MKKYIPYLVLYLLLFSSCSNSTKEMKVPETDFPVDRTFYRIGKNDNVRYADRSLKIVNNMYVLNYLDKDYAGYRISTIEYENEGNIRMSFDKEIDLAEYENSNIVLFDNDAQDAIRSMLMIKDPNSSIWQIYLNDNLLIPYKYRVVDSLDVAAEKDNSVVVGTIRVNRDNIDED